MINPINLLQSDIKEIEPHLNVVHSRHQDIPGSIIYAFTRYHTTHPIQVQESVNMVYHHQQLNSPKNFIELRYCITANRYCTQKNCQQCDRLSSKNCFHQLQVVDVFVFRFEVTFLAQFTQNVKLQDHKDEVLAFRYPISFTRTFPLCSRKRLALEGLFNHNFTGSLENIFVNAKIQELLLYTLDCLADDKEEGFSCKFLDNQSDREKIIHAREVLLQHIGDPITIKELSRKVAINECYLKKGFKEIFGTTIFDFYQQQRMEHAKYLFYNKGLSVTDVSFLLGYSSISHFSTAFKKHTGLKPCELLSPLP
jgi:AraC-like DNA-binding protein